MDFGTSSYVATDKHGRTNINSDPWFETTDHIYIYIYIYIDLKLTDIGWPTEIILPSIFAYRH